MNKDGNKCTNDDSVSSTQDYILIHFCVLKAPPSLLPQKH